MSGRNRTTWRETNVAVATTTAMAVGVVPVYVVGVLGPILVDDLSIPAGRLGWLVSASYLIGSLTSPLAGATVDRLGGRRLQVLLFAFGALSLGLLSAAMGLVSALIATMVGGIGLALSNPTTNHLVRAFARPERLGSLVGVKQSGVPVAWAVAGAVLPLLTPWFGWRTAVLALLALPAIGAMSTIALPRDDLGRGSGRDSGRRAGRGRAGARPGGADEAPASAATDTSTAARAGDAVEPGAPEPVQAVARIAWQVRAFAVVLGSGVGSVVAYLPLTAVAVAGFDATTAGVVSGTVGVSGVVARLVWGAASSRITNLPRAMAALATATSATALLVLATGRLPALTWVVAASFGATALSGMVLLTMYLLRIAPPAVLGRATGQVLQAFFAGFVPGPLLFGALLQATGNPTASWIAMSAAFAVAAATVVRVPAATDEAATPEGP